VDQLVAGLADPRYAHTSHLHVRVGGRVVVDEHLRGPVAGDVFSVTKSVLATVVGVVARQGRLPDLDAPVSDVLTALRGTAARAHTWRHLLTMTRGAQVDGPWDVDELTAHPGPLVPHIAGAPQQAPPGHGFRYDNGGCHLLAAAVTALVDEPLLGFVRRELFEPLGMEPAGWREDGQGIPLGYGHLRVSAADLGRLGQLWLDGGSVDGRPVVDAGHLGQMLRRQSAGGAPEELPYGFLTWIDADGWLAGGWAGQHVLVLPRAATVVVTTGDPRFRFGPPPSDELPDDWRPALDLVRRHLVPALG
jgi:CubicO group peptidase (beta-lactamase class C family)